MFNKDYSFSGTHADKVIALTAKIGNTDKGLFARNLDVYLAAPIVGFLYGCTAERNTSGGKTTNILLSALSGETSRLEMNYKTIMLQDKDIASGLDDRLDKAFKVSNENRANEDVERYESFVRGGIDKLYEKLIEPAKTSADHFRLLNEFLEELNDRYSEKLASS